MTENGDPIGPLGGVLLCLKTETQAPLQNVLIYKFRWWTQSAKYYVCQP